MYSFLPSFKTASSSCSLSLACIKIYFLLRFYSRIYCILGCILYAIGGSIQIIINFTTSQNMINYQSPRLITSFNGADDAIKIQAVIIQFTIKQTTRIMSNLYQRSYSPYSQDKAQENQLPLRSKAFSHLENISHHSSKYQDYNAQANEDKINGIKKKYVKDISCKTNQQNTRPPHDYNKSISIPDSHDEYNAYSPYRKSCQTPTSLYDKKQDFKVFSRHTPTKSFGAARQISTPSKQSAYSGKNQIKSQLESNRLTLNNMKNELQSKLNSLTMKVQDTKNPAPYPNTSNEPAKIFQNEDQEAYRAILNKYSKNTQVNDERVPKNKEYNIGSPASNYPNKNEQKPSSYQSKYTVSNKLGTTDEPNIKRNNLPTQYSKYNNKFDSYGQQLSKGQRQRPAEQAHIKSTIEPSRSYLNDNRYEGKSYSFIDRKESNKSNMEFTLQRAQEKPSYSPIRKMQTTFTPSNSHKYDYQKRNYSKELTNKTQTKAHQHNSSYHYQEISFAHPQKSSFNCNRSEIQQLRDKYANHTFALKDKSINKGDIKSVKKGDGKDNGQIEREIQKLDLRIKQIEQNKKDLNINFKPYQKNNPRASTTITVPQPKYQRPTQYKREAAYQYKPISTESKFTSSNYNDKDPIIPISNNDHLNNTRNKYDLKGPKPEAYERSKPISNDSYNYEPYKTQSFGFRMASSNNNQNEEPLSQRSISNFSFKKKVNNCKQSKVDSQYGHDSHTEQVKPCSTTKSLVKAFGQQAVLDETLRNNKIWFASYSKPSKWDQLKKELSSVGITIPESKLKDTFTLDDSENNPFFSVTDSKCTMKSLAQSYKESQEYWQRNIVHKFSRVQLQRQGFESSKIDCDKKGRIQVQDLVRFLNIESGTFFRNRDVSVIFKRINSKGNQIQFMDLFNIISK